MVFFPFTSSDNFSVPIGLLRASLTRSSWLFSALKSPAWLTSISTSSPTSSSINSFPYGSFTCFIKFSFSSSTYILYHNSNYCKHFHKKNKKLFRRRVQSVDKPTDKLGLSTLFPYLF